MILLEGEKCGISLNDGKVYHDSERFIVPTEQERLVDTVNPFDMT